MILENWKFDRKDENTVVANCPYFTTEVEVSKLSQDRRVLAFYNLIDDILTESERN